MVIQQQQPASLPQQQQPQQLIDPRTGNYTGNPYTRGTATSRPSASAVTTGPTTRTARPFTQARAQHMGQLSHRGNNLTKRKYKNKGGRPRTKPKQDWHSSFDQFGRNGAKLKCNQCIKKRQYPRDSSRWPHRAHHYRCPLSRKKKQIPPDLQQPTQKRARTEK